MNTRKLVMMLCCVLTTVFVNPPYVRSQPAVSRNSFHLYLLVGQSNMAGRGEVETQDKTPHPRVWVLNKDNKWQPAVEPLHFDKPEIAGTGPGFSFAKKIAAMDSNVAIGLIPCAVGGSAIRFWLPSEFYGATKSYPYDNAIARTKIALQDGMLRGILWHQGESDSDSANSKMYGEHLKRLVAQFRLDLDADSVPFIAGTLPEFFIARRPYAEIINQAIIQLPQTVPNTRVVSSSGLGHKGDETHFNTPSARRLGERYAAVYLKLAQENNMKQ